ncbi:MAG TPA: YopT-type cysteine protease domain-containing protein [Terriglobia bacterium]|nr:YopT-type cysteine protease domain-containing protein [Terriglobia bacterium]
MIRPILFMGDANGLGVGHAICCEWIRKSRKLGDVTRVRELENSMVPCANWEPSSGWQGIQDAYGFPIDRVVRRFRFDAGWLAGHCARLHGYALIVLWNGGINSPDAPQRTGHTVAVRKEPERIQYFDPNLGTLAIDTSQEFCRWLVSGPSAPGEMYPEFCKRCCEVVQV